MIELDGVEYTVKTPDENVDDLITFINDNCERKQIKNTHGEIVHIDTNEANPLYQICYGFSYLATILQKLVYNAGCSASIAEASDRQLLNLADIAGVRRNAATKTIIQGIVWAQDQVPEDDPNYPIPPCVIDHNTSATVVIAGVEVVFKPAFDLVVPPNGARQIILVAQSEGSFSIAANTITSFSGDPIPGFRKMETKASVPGSRQEPISALRARMQRRGVDGTQIDKAAEAIQQLPGISLCNIYFNMSPRNDTEVPYGDKNIRVPPRTALIYVQGASPDVAKVFYRYLLCDTAGKDVEEAIPSYYTTKAGQRLEVVYLPPVQVPIHIKLFVKNTLNFEQIAGIKDTITSLAASITIGQELSSVTIINAVQAVYTTIVIQGAELSKDGTHWDYKQAPGASELFIFDSTKILVQEVEA